MTAEDEKICTIFNSRQILFINITVEMDEAEESDSAAMVGQTTSRAAEFHAYSHYVDFGGSIRHYVERLE